MRSSLHSLHWNGSSWRYDIQYIRWIDRSSTLNIFLGFQDLRVTSDHGKRRDSERRPGNMTFPQQHRIEADIRYAAFHRGNSSRYQLPMKVHGPPSIPTWAHGCCKIISGKGSWQNRPETYRRTHVHPLALIYTSVISANCINRLL